MRLRTAFFFLFYSLYLFGQDYQKVEQIIRNYPESFSSVKELSDKINYDFKLDEEKIRALYDWLALNIDYNSKKDVFDIGNTIIIYSTRDDKKRQENIRKENRLKNILTTKKAICIGYSEIFKAVCDAIGIESEIVTGYSKIYIDDIENEKNYKNHAWNVVKINNEWKLIDVTWASTFIKGMPTNSRQTLYDYYFFTDPKELILTHFPSNSKWQLLKTKVSKKDFFKTPLLYTNYFKTEIKLTDIQKGAIEIHKKKLQIYFDKIPKNETIYYLLEGNEGLKPLPIKASKNGTFIASIDYRKSQSSHVTIYAGRLPLVGFKIHPISK